MDNACSRFRPVSLRSIRYMERRSSAHHGWEPETRRAAGHAPTWDGEPPAAESRRHRSRRIEVYLSTYGPRHRAVVPARLADDSPDDLAPHIFFTEGATSRSQKPPLTVPNRLSIVGSVACGRCGRALPARGRGCSASGASFELARWARAAPGLCGCGVGRAAPQVARPRFGAWAAASPASERRSRTRPSRAWCPMSSSPITRSSSTMTAAWSTCSTSSKSSASHSSKPIPARSAERRPAVGRPGPGAVGRRPRPALRGGALTRRSWVRQPKVWADVATGARQQPSA